MTAPHYIRPDHHPLPTGSRNDGAGHDGTSLNRRPKPSTAPPGLFAPAPEVVVEKTVKAKRRQKTTVAEGRPSRAKQGPRQIAKEAACGSLSGYNRHFRVTHTPPCEACKDAKNAYERAKYKPAATAPKPEPACGTASGYRRHRTKGEPTCEPCKAANNQAQREAWQRRIDNGWVRKRNTKESAA